MIIIINKWLPLGRRFYALNLFGIIFSKGECDEETLNHERIHTAQMREWLYIPFYLFYFVEWVINLLKTGDLYRAYRDISFEKEAYTHQSDKTYLGQRKLFANYRKGYEKS